MRRPHRRWFGTLVTAALVATVTTMSPVGTAPAGATSCPTPSVSLSGAGTDASPYLIASAADLLYVSLNDVWNESFQQTADIDLSGCFIDPIGGFNDALSADAPFTGTYDGNGKSISNVTIPENYTQPMGLFGTVDNATISALTLTNVTVASSSTDVGALVGLARGSTTITDITAADVDVTSSAQNVGGLVGRLSVTNSASLLIRDVTVSGTVTSGGNNAGGLIGYLQAGATAATPGIFVIDGATVDVATTATTTSAGGLIGWATTLHAQSSVLISDVTVSGDVDVVPATGSKGGGLIGLYDGNGFLGVAAATVSGSVKVGVVPGYNASEAGGLIGSVNNSGGVMSLTDITRSGDVIGDGGGVGGLLGFAMSGDSQTPARLTIRDVDVSSDVNADPVLGWYVGGLIGYLDAYRVDMATVSASGIVNGALAVGGIAGYLKVRGPGANVESRMDNVTARGPISADGGQGGGLIGFLNAEGALFLEDVSALGGVTSGKATSGRYAGKSLSGGLIGMLTVANSDDSFVRLGRSAAIGSVSGTGDRIGGLIGFVEIPSGTDVGVDIVESYATGDVSASQGAALKSIGGLIGEASVGAGPLRISDSYAHGDLFGDLTEAGGLIGRADAGAVGIEVARTYSTSEVINPSDPFGSPGPTVGGLIGVTVSAGAPVSVSASFWESGMITDNGIGTAKTRTQMKDASTFRGASWSISNGVADATKTWAICSGQDYPFLMWQTDLVAQLPGAASCSSGESGGDEDGDGSLPPPPAPPTSTESLPEPDRIGGGTRFDTSTAISQEFFDPGVPVVYLATAANFADALVAGPAAGYGGGPVLLTERDSLPATTLAELRRLDPDRIVVVGGTSVISTNVFASLAGVAPAVVRIGGENRYETAALLTRDATTPPVPIAYVATGEDYADAVAGGPSAGLDGAPILLVQRDSIPAATIAELQRLDPDRIVVLGLTAAVSTTVEAQLAAYAPVVQRIGGATRYETSAELSASKYAPGVSVAFLATGTGFADALSAVPAATITGGPVLLTRPACVPRAVVAELVRLQPGRIVVLGGETALTTAVSNLTVCAT